MQSPLLPRIPQSPIVAAASTKSVQPVNTVEIQCKRICVLRCLHAVTCNVAMQFLLLALFLLFVNFSVWHPIEWVVQTLKLILSIYTWLYITPLISVVIIYGIYLGKSYLHEQQMFRTRFMIIYKTTLPKCLFFTLHFFIGYLTTWLYSRFLSEDYQSLFLNRSECTTDDYQLDTHEICVNEKFVLISLYGAMFAIWYCWKRDPTQQACEFPIIHQSKYLRIRAFLYSVLWSTLVQVFVPVIVSHFLYSLIGRLPFQLFLRRILPYEFVLNGNVHVYDVKLMAIVWILSTHVLSNLQMMAFLFQVFLTQPEMFPIEAGSLTENGPFANQATDLALVQALANTKVPIVRQLAALDLYTLSEYGDMTRRRQQIFALSVPGGHPYNWNALSAQCISLINAFNGELSAAIKNLKSGSHQLKLNSALPGQAKCMQTFTSNLIAAPQSEFRSSTPTSATEMAEKVRNRQYNESCGIRNMLAPTPTNEELLSPIKPVADSCARFNQTILIFQQKVQNMKQTILNIPGIRFFFGENEMAQLHALLTISKADEIGWIVQGISSITVHSLKEDRYGVVQMNLPEIIHTLLQLRESINQLPSSLFNVSATSPYLRNFQTKPSGAIVLRNAVKRSLYNICITFNEYLPELVANQSDLRILQNYTEFLEA